MTAAPAAPTCTISFRGDPTGGGSTAWGTAANWSPQRLPGANDDVCIGPAWTVVHSTGTDTVLSIQSQGDLQLTGGSLTLTRTTDPSPITQLEMTSGTLAGAAKVVIGSSMTWSGGAMDGSGTTAVAPGPAPARSPSAPRSSRRVR